MSESPIDIRGANILIVDDRPSNLDVLVDTIEAAAFSISIAKTGERAIKIAQTECPSLILLDIAMPGMDGIEVCRHLKTNPVTKDIPVIFLTADTEQAKVLAGFKAGAVDYITKPFLKDEVFVRIRTHLERALLIKELAEKNDALEAEMSQRRVLDNQLSMLAKRDAARWGIEGFIGQSPTMHTILREINLLQNASSTSVLIMGESGTGKELIARAIHAGSDRAEKPFITVNCAAIPGELAESLLFGHLAGAFTGAQHMQTGFFEMADCGTLFLDEVGSMPATIQPKLLRVLEDGLIRPLGDNKDKQVDVRVISATNEQTKTLREDLYYRLARFTVTAPPLRERKDDIPLLTLHFMQMFADEMGVHPPGYSADAQKVLAQYDYPGNVRELKNIVERAMIESGGKEIAVGHLRLDNAAPSHKSSPETGQAVHEIPLNYAKAEQLLIQRALDASNGNVTQAARLLGIDRNKLYRIQSKARS